MKNKKLNWKKFTNKSDISYRNVKDGCSVDILKNHNIIKDADLELSFISSIVKYIFGSSFQGRALDLCCGAGFFSSELVKRGFDVTAVELNPDAIEIASKREQCVRFIVGDVTQLIDIIGDAKFDLIIAREAHPFTRIGDWKFHKNILSQYVSLLNDGGVVCISHASFGGNMNFDSIDFEKAKKYLEEIGFEVIGPICFFLFKHMKIKPINMNLIRIISTTSKLLQRIFNQRWIGFFIAVKKTCSCNKK